MSRIVFAAICAAIAFLRAAAVAQPTPEMLVEVVDITSLAVSPDLNRVAFRTEQASIADNRYFTTWYVQDVNGSGPPVAVADGGEAIRNQVGVTVPEPPVWSPDGRYLYFRGLSEEEVQVWRADIGAQTAQRMTDDPANVVSFSIAPDGQSLTYAAGATRADIRAAERAEYDSGILIDGTIPVGQPLFRYAQVDGRLATQRYTGNWMERRGLLADEALSYQSLDLVTGRVRAAPPPAAAEPQGVTRETGVRAVSREGEVAFLDEDGVLSVEGGTRDSVRCTDAICASSDIDALAWRPGGSEVIFTVTDRERGYAQSLYAWDIEANATRLVVHTKGIVGDDGYSLDRPCALAAEVALCTTASAAVPPRIERIDLDTGARQILFEPNTGLIEAGLPEVEFLTWRDAGGNRFSGQFFPAVAEGAGPTPLFITYYVCRGHLRGGVGDEWPLASLAANGIASLCINRPAPDYENRDQLDDYRMAQSGVEAIIRDLARTHNIDPERVGMGGMSFGSEVVTYISGHSDLLAAASVSSSAVTPIYYWMHSLQPDFADRLKRSWHLSSPDDASPLWRELSPVFHAEAFQAPLLMHMAEQEYLGAFEYFARILNAGGAAEMYVFPHEPHIKFQPRHKLAIYQRNLDWFRYWLLDRIDPSPERRDQYLRWEHLRERVGTDAAEPENPG
ncbi:Atxe2 family lasso peptide isopeptidase [Parvularcula flava]|uniref:Atxe2 family lasso peptide isopeptidase n=1 Tax=Aquisalinus luteolus TaxID=1566827 RepID=A0A8J3A291_9PROT|nr:Atxe2 family lasso peptide isopeptidase [Aquisalinus luteolus]NHK27168.1 Atxe2 family lasso peptide isopeptidase [Aquisalinus luteolus]GGH94603.1 peptidase S9 [Aquisalinus luteolus]